MSSGFKHFTYLIRFEFRTKFFLFFLISAVLSCKQHLEDEHSETLSPKLVQTKGYVVPKNSIALPEHIIVDEEKLRKIPAGKPVIIPFKINMHKAGNPRIISAGKPKTIIPGTDTFLLPQTVVVVEKPFAAGNPEVIPAREMTFKTPNHSSFGSFGKLHGLKHTIVTSLLQDKLGNLWICTAAGVSKYDGSSFSNFTEKDGLANNDIRSVLQDKSGNIWFGSLGGGVSRYDGVSFTNFSVNDGLSDNNVVSMIEDKSGNIWFGTWNGVTKYDGHSFTNFRQREGLVNHFVQAVLEDRSGNIWFGTNGGVSKYDGYSFTNFTEEQGLSENNVFSILEDKSGNLWFGTIGGGVSIFNGTSFTYIANLEGLINNEVHSIFEDRNGNIWLGTHYGLSKYNGLSFTNFTEKEGLSNDNIYCILEDKSGNLWFGTGGGGVSKYDPHSFTHITEADGLGKKYVFSTYEDKSGNIWFGTWRGGAAEYDGRSLKVFTVREGLIDNDIRSICQDKDGNLWFATSKGVSKYDHHSFLHFTEREGLVNNNVNTVMEDRLGNLWIGTAGGVSKYDGRSFKNFTFSEGLIHNNVYAITEDRSGNIWFGTSGGAAKYNGDSFTHFAARQGLHNEVVYSIKEDKFGNIWFGTEGGVVKYDGHSFIYFTEREGLLSNSVSSILEDKSGNLWVGTRFGLSRLSSEKLALFSDRIKSNSISGSDIFFKNYTYADGFLGIGCNTNAILQSRDGSIWVGTNGGATVFNPRKVPVDTAAPNIQLTAIKLFNEKIDWTKLDQKGYPGFILGNGVKVSNFHFKGLSKWYNLPLHLSLAYYNNYIVFDFVGITMGQPQNVKYQYWLEGMDRSMSVLTDQTTASYSNLLPGTYTFKVKAMNSEGYWSHELAYTFIIRPPWWQTWWFKTLAITTFFVFVIFITRIIYIYQLRKQKAVVEKQLAVEYERQRISSDLHDEIGSSLSSINIYTSLAKNGNNKEDYLDSINQNVGEVITKLDDLVWSINPRYDSLSSVVSRIRSYAEPLSNAKNIRLTVENGLDGSNETLSADTKNHLYLVAKELVNNAIKHSGCRVISVSFHKHNNWLRLVVEDDGSGFDIKVIDSQRNGLYNINRRVNALNGTIDSESEIGKGARITVSIPVA